MVGLLQLFFVGHAKEPATEGLQHVQSEHCCKSHYLNIASILHELHWLPVKMCIDYKILSLVVCSCRHGTASQYLRELIPCYLSVPVSVTLQPVSSSHPQCWPRKQQQQQNVESEHFPVLHQNCGTVCPALWEDVWHKAWRPPCLRELGQLRLCTSDSAFHFSFLLLLLLFFFFFWKLQWACHCSVGIHLCSTSFRYHRQNSTTVCTVANYWPGTVLVPKSVLVAGTLAPFSCCVAVASWYQPVSARC